MKTLKPIGRLVAALVSGVLLILYLAGPAFAHGSPFAHEEPAPADASGNPDTAAPAEPSTSETSSTPTQPEQSAGSGVTEPISAEPVSAPAAERTLSPVAAVALGASAAFFPVLAGLLMALRSYRWSGRARALLDGAVAGALLFLFLDFMSLTANLGIGLRELAGQALFITLFVAGMIGLAASEAGWRGAGAAAADRRVAYLWALGIGFHTLGEGLIMGYNLHLGLGAALRFLPLLSFMLHKLAEGVSVAALIGGERPTLRSLVGMSLVAGLPAVPGVLMGFLGAPGAISNYFYALGAGALVYVLPKVFRVRAGKPEVAGYVGVAGGLIFMYLAALLHEI